MSFQSPILDSEMSEDIKAYLDKKRQVLKEALSLAFLLPPEHAPMLPAPDSEINLREINQKIQAGEWRGDYKLLEASIHVILNEYVEILQGMVHGLFDQLGRAGIDQWSPQLYEKVDAAKDLLLERNVEAETLIKGLNKTLKTLHDKTQEKGWMEKIKAPFQSYIDPDLIKKTRETTQFLNSQSKDFSKQFLFLTQSYEQIAKEEQAFSNFLVLDTLEPAARDFYVRTFRLVRLFDLNRKEDKLPPKMVAKSLKHSLPAGKVNRNLHEYLHAMQDGLCQVAKTCKEHLDASSQAVICFARSEIHSFKLTVEKMHLFWKEHEGVKRGVISFFKKHVPRRAQELSQLSKEAVELDASYKRLLNISEGGAKEDPVVVRARLQTVDNLLHDLNQPLLSNALFKKKAEELSLKLLELDELTSTSEQVIFSVRKALIALSLLDLHYHELSEMENFHKAYDIHRGMLEIPLSPSHYKRMKLYYKVINQIKHGIKAHDLNEHAKEIEHEIHDAQEALQEFFRLSQNGGLQLFSMQEELLEESHLFDNFFYFLKKKDLEGRYLRQEFAFVDNYFDAIRTNLQL